MTRRPGLSLTEVLAALFIMALGTISILTMFPLGALQMGQALKDDRTSQAASQADGYMRAYWRQYVVDPRNGTGQGPEDTNLTSAFGTPGGSLTPLTAASGTSYPVFADPIGFYGQTSRDWVANQTNVGIPGETSNWSRTRGTGAPTYALRTCSLMDGLGYDQTGAANATSGTVERDMRYNWLWVLQLPAMKDPNTANMTVVVFDKRAHQFAPSMTETVVSLSGAAVIPGTTTSLTISVPSGTVVQKGTWVLDATIDNTQGIRHAIYYRVVSATPNTGNASFLDIELQTPIRRADGQTGAAFQFNLNTLVVPAGVVEVFERSPLNSTGQ